MIPIKTKEEIEVMAMGGHVLKQVFDDLSIMIKPGIKTIEIERKAEKIIRNFKGKPSFKGQNGFPFCICASLNEEIVHGLPSNRELKDGDVFTLDFGIFFKLETILGNDFDKKLYPNILNGFHTDMARTYIIGEADTEIKRLVNTTRKMLKIGIKKIRPGITLGDLGETMQRYAEKQGFAVMRELCGHGIGKDLHEQPDVLNYGQRHRGIKLEAGMVLCLEPMLSLGDYHIKLSKNGFTYETKDKSISAHFEDMVAVVEDGSRVLTD
ncbi:MAG: type I methionyl aminopeptidase [Candidatus Pacebacteria bacterium]|nr:type I methionyl aminopeptidase [Candidatus Paceibacterota bacterium]